MKRVYLGNKELTTIATVTNGGGGGDDTQKWVDYFNGTLTEFTVPEGVTKINTATFCTFTGLTSLTLPSSITSIENVDMIGMHGEVNPFGSLKTMTVKATTPPTILSYGEIIPSTISRIDVPKYSANIYKAIDNWNKYADKIQTLPQNETVVTYNDGTTKKFDIKGELTKDNIENITAATKVVIGDDVTSIGYRAFKQCFKLTSIILSDSVTSIDYEAFSYSYRLVSITIPNSVTAFNTYSFQGCSGLESVIIKNSTNKLTYTQNLFGGISSTAKLYVPASVLSDYQADSNWTGAFKGGIYAAENIMKVTYTDGTEKTFTGSTAIKSDTDSNKKNAKNVVIYDTVSLINESAFENCSGMTSVVIPDSVIYIGESAFNTCKSLTSVEIPNSVTRINNFAFANCTYLESITIPASVTSIGDGAFRDCSSLTDITLPDGITSIGNGAFQDCSSLTGITIPASVTSIIDFAFQSCSKLSSVTIQNSTSKLEYNYNAFANISSSAKLYVPSNLLSDYQSDSNWTNKFKGGIYAIQ